MSTVWKVYRWIWKLESPLYIGLPPAESLNRCRLYVPARTLQGAIDSELARLKVMPSENAGNDQNQNKNKNFPDYGKLGHEVGCNCRFTYLYPAEQSETDADTYFVWLPQFGEKEGRQWQCYLLEGEAVCSPLSERDFRKRLLGTYARTAINPESDTATEGTLHELECIQPWWRENDAIDKTASTKAATPKAVFLVGYVFLKNCAFTRRFTEDITTLFLGGDTRYGLGKIRRVEWKEVTENKSIFSNEVQVEFEEVAPLAKSPYAWGHAAAGKKSLEENNNSEDVFMIGAQELLGGWEWQKGPHKFSLMWVPGSAIKKDQKQQPQQEQQQQQEQQPQQEREEQAQKEQEKEPQQGQQEQKEQANKQAEKQKKTWAIDNYGCWVELEWLKQNNPKVKEKKEEATQEKGAECKSAENKNEEESGGIA